MALGICELSWMKQVLEYLKMQCEGQLEFWFDKNRGTILNNVHLYPVQIGKSGHNFGKHMKGEFCEQLG